MAVRRGRVVTEINLAVIGSVTPPGTIAPFGGGTVPTGWLLCDGSLVSRTTYAALFEAISTNWGAGDSATTFALPDLRGRFVRGTDNMGTGAAGRDVDAASRTAAATGGATGNAVGSVQDEATASHRHLLFANVASSNQTMNSSSYTAFRSSGGLSGYDYWHGNTGTDASLGLSSTQTGGAGGTSETRPKNANANYIIKT